MRDLDPNFLHGSYVPLVTPFRDGAVDYATFGRLVEFQIANGTDGLVITGTSGEPSVLSIDERAELYRRAISLAAGRVPVVAATGSQSMAETLELTRRADEAGADAVLVVTPYYIRPPQRGLVEYFAAVCGSTKRPVLIYHIPGRAAVAMDVASVAAVAERAENLVGLKQATNDLGMVTRLLDRLGPDFRIFVGLEELSFPMLAIGASGMMNAAANLAPDSVADLGLAVAKGALDEARSIHYRLAELNDAVFWDTNPIPVKYLMWRLGLLAVDEHRLPMVPPTPELAARLDDLLARTSFLSRHRQG